MGPFDYIPDGKKAVRIEDKNSKDYGRWVLVDLDPKDEKDAVTMVASLNKKLDAAEDRIADLEATNKKLQEENEKLHIDLLEKKPKK